MLYLTRASAVLVTETISAIGDLKMDLSGCMTAKAILNLLVLACGTKRKLVGDLFKLG